MHEVEVRAVSPSLGSEALIVELDEVVVFGMNDHDAVVLGDLLHGQLNASHVQTHSNTSRMRRHHVGREDLEARKALLDHVADLVEYAEGKRTDQADVE